MDVAALESLLFNDSNALSENKHCSIVESRAPVIDPGLAGPAVDATASGGLLYPELAPSWIAPAAAARLTKAQQAGSCVQGAEDDEHLEIVGAPSPRGPAHSLPAPHQPSGTQSQLRKQDQHVAHTQQQDVVSVSKAASTSKRQSAQDDADITGINRTHLHKAMTSLVRVIMCAS